MLKESEVQKLIRLDASANRHRLFRNNSGLYYTKDRRPVKISLAEGSSDLIGWTSVKITKEMVGLILPVFTAIETKAEGVNLSKMKGETVEKQKMFIESLRGHGAVAGFAQSNQDYKNILTEWLKNLLK